MKNKITKLGLLVLTGLLAAVLYVYGPATTSANQANDAKIAAKANAAANADKALAGCYDTKINNAMRTAIRDNPNFLKIARQINWNSKDCVIELVGYAGWTGDRPGQGYDRHMAIIRLAWTISPDVRGVIHHDFKLSTPPQRKVDPSQCVEPEWVMCNDICVRAGTCNSDPGSWLVSPTPRP